MPVQPILLFCWLVIASSNTSGAEAVPVEPSKIPRIAAAEARHHVSKTCAVELTVKSSRHLTGPGLWVLNSCKNYRDPENFTVVIWEKGRQALKARQIEDPAQYYRAKRIRVTGKISLYQRRPQIVVEKAAQIEIVKKAKEESDQEAETAAEKDDDPQPEDQRQDGRERADQDQQ